MTECDNYPAPELLEEFPNWIEDMTGRSRFVVGGCHVKPQKQAERIQANTNLSAGDVWFPDGTRHVALIKLAEAYALGIIVYDQKIWGLKRLMDDSNPYDPFRFRVTNQWKVCDLASPCPNLQDPDVFPLKYCTRLACTSTRAAIHGAISTEGLNQALAPNP